MQIEPRYSERQFSGMTSPLASPAERHVSHIIQTRAIRARFFDRKLFADPVWDILLALHRAELRQRRVTVSTCCSAANVPPTTALRWITKLCDRGIVLRTPDPLDARRTFLTLADEASSAMKSFLRAFTEMAAEAGLQRDYLALHQYSLESGVRNERRQDVQC